MIRKMTVSNESEQEIKQEQIFRLKKDRWLEELAVDVIHQCRVTLQQQQCGTLEHICATVLSLSEQDLLSGGP
jgi:hypothetical protein